MTKPVQDAPYLKITLDEAGQPVLTPDQTGTVVSREEYDELFRQLEQARYLADSNEGMAECMRMFRRDMIEAGVVTEQTPPMFMSEGVGSYIVRLSRQVAKDRLGKDL